MPVTTRSKSQGLSISLSTPESVEPHLSVKPSLKAVKDSSYPTAPKDFTQNPVASKKSRRLKRVLPTTQEPQKKPRKHQNFDAIKQSQTTTDSSPPELADSVITHTACRFCSCPQGAFKYPIDACIRCGHKMDHHEDFYHDWNSNCDNVCERRDLVTSILQLVRETRVVVIRATPQTGKSTLLLLLGRHVLDEHRDLEPVFVHWEFKAERDGLAYNDFLRHEALRWQERNTRYRPKNPQARPIYLIDEAQNSYEEPAFWTSTLKNHNTGSQPLFVLVCLYGAADTLRSHDSKNESQASKIDSFQRVELRPSASGRLCMLFTPWETAFSVRKWAISQNFRLENDVSGYLHAATDGHPGMIGLILRHFELYFPQFPDHIRHARVWSPSLCNEAIVENDALVDWFGKFGRGLWTINAEQRINKILLNPSYSNIKYSDMANALREVATRPRGYTRLEKEFDALTFCYKMGFVYTEPARPGSKEITYMFASPIHRRVAYRRLFPGPELGSTLDTITLQQACLNAVARFSPSVLQDRSTNSRANRGIPEAALQDEIYCCLSHELRNLPIFSEYSHTRDGRIDFYISDKKWGIEVIQYRSKRDITEHTARFRAGGKYARWSILDDYVILYFCSQSNIRDLEIEEVEIQSHILQIVIEPGDYKAEVYTHDKKLRATLILGEGRERFGKDCFDSGPPFERSYPLDASSEGKKNLTIMLQEQEMLQDEVNLSVREKERESKRQKKEEQERENLHKQMEIMRRQMEKQEQEGEIMRRQMEIMRRQMEE